MWYDLVRTELEDDVANRKQRPFRIVVLDEEFNKAINAQSDDVAGVDFSLEDGTFVESGNVRVVFPSGASLDLFVDDSDDRLYVSGQLRDGYIDEVLLVGASQQGHDFAITMGVEKSKKETP